VNSGGRRARSPSFRMLAYHHLEKGGKRAFSRLDIRTSKLHEMTQRRENWRIITFPVRIGQKRRFRT